VRDGRGEIYEYDDRIVYRHEHMSTPSDMYNSRTRLVDELLNNTEKAILSEVDRRSLFLCVLLWLIDIGRYARSRKERENSFAYIHV
jgi:hypothetical protein